jgi:superfamily I DNA and/or RNA helicase
MFWEHGVGIITPHRAQVSKIAEYLTQSFAGSVAHRVIRSAVDTVERFQGQERDVIIASFGLGDPDVIRLEDEFLYSLNRFNVMASRARCKLIVLITQSLLEYLSDDQDVLRESALLKRFAEDYCRNIRKLSLPVFIGGIQMTREGELRDRN